MGWVKLSIIVMVFCAVKCFAMSQNELEDFEDFLAKTSQLTPSLKHGTGDFDEHVGDVISDNAWEESGKFEGDLILNEYQRKLLVQNVAQEQGLARNGVIDGAKRWPNNEVIFAIQVEHFSLDQVQAILNGIDDIARVSCVKFRPYRHGDPDAVVIQGNRRGCFSQVGYQGGYQALNLHSRHPVGLGCFRHGTVVHEMLHTLGFYHMQSSPDRDDYVDIIWDNILKSSKHNFRKYNMFAVSDFGVGYDYDSVLHYSGNAFSINGKPTIVPKQAGAQIGQRVGLSDKDTKKLNIMYCNSDLDNGQLIESSTEKSKKKKVKNKPFEGHGLGYHKGMTVAFKLSPEAEIYKLADVPGSQGYDGFSKRPQILSITAENENFSGDKKIKYSYKPPIPLLTGGYTEPVYYEKKPSKVNNNGVPPTDTSEAHGEQNSDITEALDRLTGIIKTHVYPSHPPDLRIYHMDDRYTEHGNHGKVGNEKALLAMEHMEHMDRMAKGETAKEGGNLYDDFISKIATDGSYYSDPEEKKSKKLAVTIPGYQDEHDKYLYKFNMDYLGENLYEKNFFLNRDEDKSLINHDGWFQEFKPFQNNPSNDNRQRYLDRSKFHSKGDDRDDETVRRYY